MVRQGALLLLGAILLAPGTGLAQTPSEAPGPPAFAERSLYLLHIPFLFFGPADRRALAPASTSWKVETAYANTFSSSWHALTFHRLDGLSGEPLTQAEADKMHRDFPNDAIFLVEGDVLRESVTGRFGVSPTLSASFELVYLSHDAFHGLSAIESFHRTFGFEQAGRDEFPPDSFLVLLQRPGGPITFDAGTPSSGWGDTSVTISWRQMGEGPLRYGIDAAVKAPTGSATKYDGSGSWDGGALAFLAREGSLWSLDAEGGLVVPGPWKAKAGLRVAPYARWMLAASRRFGERTRVGVSGTIEQSPFRRDGVGDVSRAGAEIGLGVSHTLRAGGWAALVLTEHVAAFGDRADIGLTLRFGYR